MPALRQHAARGSGLVPRMWARSAHARPSTAELAHAGGAYVRAARIARRGDRRCARDAAGHARVDASTGDRHRPGRNRAGTDDAGRDGPDDKRADNHRPDDNRADHPDDPHDDVTRRDDVTGDDDTDRQHAENLHDPGHENHAARERNEIARSQRGERRPVLGKPRGR